MAQAGGYLEELEAEFKQHDPNSHASRLVAQGKLLSYSFLPMLINAGSRAAHGHANGPCVA